MFSAPWTRVSWCGGQACRKCQEEKPAEEFPQKKSHPDGRDDYCKACHARATAARVAARGPVKEPTVESKVLLTLLLLLYHLFSLL